MIVSSETTMIPHHHLHSLLFLLPTVLCLSLEKQVQDVTLSGYHSHDQLVSALDAVASKYSNLVSKYNIGSSVQVRTSQFVEIPIYTPLEGKNNSSGQVCNHKIQAKTEAPGEVCC